jgi:basic amino acid/polyamine antiporter, APA family
MIGVGIFTTTGFLAGDLGHPSLVLAIWFVGAGIALAGALCYSELAVNFPRSGGEYVYLSEAWGRTWGFIDGWVSFFAGFSAPIAAAALAISAYVGYFVPELQSVVPGIPVSGGQVLAAAIVAAFTALNLVGVSQVAALQNVLTATKLAVIGVFLVAGLTVGTGDWSHFSDVAVRTSTNSVPAQFAISLVFVFYAYSGWNAAVYVAEEIRDPDRTLPVALACGTVAVALLYVALNTLFIFASALENMKGVVAVGAHAATALFGSRAGGMFSAAMAVSLLATVNAMCMIGPRVYYAMAQDGSFFTAASKVHPRWHTPWVAVLAQGICACVLILTGTFESLAYYIGFSLFLFSALSVLALFKFRKRTDWKRSRWVNMAYPMLPVMYISMSLWVFVYFVQMRGWEALWSAVTIAAGALTYQFIPKPTPR